MSSIQLGSDTLAVTPSPGAHEYNGQHYMTDSNSARAQVERLTVATAQNSTSGTSITFSSIPAWAKKITVMFNGVSSSGASNWQIQIGSGSITTTGYIGCGSVVGASTVVTQSYTTGFGIKQSTLADTASGLVTLVNVSGNIWVASGLLGGSSASTATYSTGGNITLSGALDRVVITTVNGTDTFDAGSINIMYEG